jgi:hypothetical protein
MNFHPRTQSLRAAAIGMVVLALALPGSASAATEQSSTGTLVGAVTCGADAITPAANAVVLVHGLSVKTRTDSSGRFTLPDVPAGQGVTIDAAVDPQGSLMTSRFNVVAQSGQTLDIGSVDLDVCPSPSAPVASTSEHEMEQRGSPTD